ncbi:Flavin-containing monooxygenase FMO GS-OX1 [Borealophlyctis nickersoniae]|nr:Flavin-containing monooxygenase FMO GS-OX1 [Borealophlyctis nickersoniae]
MQKNVHRIIVVGAGAAGLAAAKNLRNSFDVLVLERKDDVGGTWIYTDCTGADLTFPPPTSTPMPPSAIYESLHTNLPPFLMQYSDLPFPANTPLFPPHTIVKDYLASYANKHNLRGLIQFGVDVMQCVWNTDDSRWTVRSKSIRDGTEHTHYADALVVASGHYSTPRVPHIPGIEEFPNRMLHTINYRTPKPFTGERVLIIGGGSSGIDIARDLAPHASHVLVSTRSAGDHGDIGESVASLDLDVISKPAVKCVKSDGAVEFVDGSIVKDVDVILFATGYLYDFPFLDSTGKTLVDQNDKKDEATLLVSDGLGVHNLAHMVFYRPNPMLSFIGLPLKVDPFPLFELQSLLIAHAYSHPSHLGSLLAPGYPGAFHEESSDGSRTALVLGPRQYTYWNWISQIVGMKGVGREREDARKEVLIMRKRILGY